MKTNLKGIVVAVACALVVSLVSLTGSTGTARAAASDCNYPYGTIACFWYDSNFTGLRTDYYVPSYGTCHNFSSTFNDKVSSIRNWTWGLMILYKHANCSYALISLSPWTDRAYVGDGANDQLSSFRLIYQGP